jgi:hypothetical protein
LVRRLPVLFADALRLGAMTSWIITVTALLALYALQPPACTPSDDGYAGVCQKKT